MQRWALRRLRLPASCLAPLGGNVLSSPEPAQRKYRRRPSRRRALGCHRRVASQLGWAQDDGEVCMHPRGSG